LAAQRLAARLETDLPIVLDGGVRNALKRAGLDVNTPFGTAIAMQQGHQSVLIDIHRQFVQAGVHVLRTNTSDTTPDALQRAGYGYRAAKLSNRAVDAAMDVADASDRSVAVAGVLPSVLVDPGARADVRAREELLAHAQRLAAGGCDLLLVHGATTLRQAVAATAAASHTDLMVLVELHIGDDGNLAGGEPLNIVMEALAGAGARGFIAVTSTPAAELQALSFLSGQERAWGILRSACELDPEEYAARVSSFITHGARFVGGEPDATPNHIRALIRHVPLAAREVKRPSMLPSVPPNGLG